MEADERVSASPQRDDAASTGALSSGEEGRIAPPWSRTALGHGARTPATLSMRICPAAGGPQSLPSPPRPTHRRAPRRCTCRAAARAACRAACRCAPSRRPSGPSRTASPRSARERTCTRASTHSGVCPQWRAGGESRVTGAPHKGPAEGTARRVRCPACTARACCEGFARWQRGGGGREGAAMHAVVEVRWWQGWSA